MTTIFEKESAKLVNQSAIQLMSEGVNYSMETKLKSRLQIFQMQVYTSHFEVRHPRCVSQITNLPILSRIP
jgi:hypothetical protein